MPEEEVARLEKAAIAIKPADPAVIHQRLFNAHDHVFLTADNYEEDKKALAETREKAVAEVLKRNGPEQILKMAKAVKHPVELGSAMGRIGSKPLDDFLLPRLLDDKERALNELIRGYVPTRLTSPRRLRGSKLFGLRFLESRSKRYFFSDLPFVARFGI